MLFDTFCIVQDEENAEGGGKKGECGLNPFAVKTWYSRICAVLTNFKIENFLEKNLK